MLNGSGIGTALRFKKHQSVKSSQYAMREFPSYTMIA